jgi:acetyl esterase
MPIDPQAQAILDTINRVGGPSLTEIDPAVARRLSDPRRLRPGPDVATSDRCAIVAGREIPLRTYRPHGADRPLSAVVYFHGGGFVLGSIDGHDAVCRQLALDAGCLVASVEYRLAPEHKFPAAVEDAYAATCWIYEHAAALGIDRARFAVAGESAGGNLATVVCAMAKAGHGPRLLFQALVTPVTDLRELDTPSYHENATGYLLTRSMMAWFRDQYLNRDDDRGDPRCSPLASRDLGGLPPALVITAEFDPLRDEGAAYASALQAAGVPVRLSRYDGMIHTFVSLCAYMDAGRAAVAEIAACLRNAFEASPASGR